MKRPPLTFLLAGLTGGVITVVIARIWPTVLIGGVGLLFFVALLAAVAISASWSRVRGGVWRYFAGLVISTAAYLVGLFVFSVATGYSPDVFGVSASSDISHFGPDVAIGLAASLVSSACIELLASLLTGRWSNRFFVYLSVVGLASVGATYLAHLFVQQAWAFFGVLLPVGEALFCWIIGLQIWQIREQIPIPTTAGR
jgi:hypothetical protein